MSEQGERRGPRIEQQDDWWRQLYDADASDTGRAEGGDTLDDRFASVTRTVGPGAGRTSGRATRRRGGEEMSSGTPQQPAGAVDPGVVDPAQPVDPAEPSASAEPDRSPAVDGPGQSTRTAWPATDSLDPWHLGPTYPDPPRPDDPDPADPDPADPSDLDGSASASAPEPAEWPPAPATSPPTQVPQNVPEPASEPPESNPPASEPPASPAVEPPSEPEPVSEQMAVPDPAAVPGPEPVPEPAAAPRPPQGVEPTAEPYAWDRTAPPGAAGPSALEQSPAPDVSAPPPARRPEPPEAPAAHPEELAELIPDTVLDGARHGQLALRTASLRGDTARERGEPRRDTVFTARFGRGTDALLLVAVATGAGPADAAGAAARNACHVIASAVGRSHARLAEDIAADRRGALKSGLQRLTDRSHGRLCPSPEADQPVDGTEVHTPGLRCLLLPADPDCLTRVVFGIGGGGFFRLREGVWQDIEPSVAPPPASTGPAPEAAGRPATQHTAGAGAAGTTAPGATGVPYGAPEPGADPRATMHLGFPAPAALEQPPPEPFHTEPARPQPFLFRASTARPGDTLLLASAGLAEPLREAPHFAERLAVRWSDTGAAPELAAFLAEVQPRPRDAHGADRTAAAVWEGDGHRAR